MYMLTELLCTKLAGHFHDVLATPVSAISVGRRAYELQSRPAGNALPRQPSPGDGSDVKAARAPRPIVLLFRELTWLAVLLSR
jgi:hypothetical protein